MGVEPADTAFAAGQFDAIYPPGVERHYWNRCRNSVIEDMLRRVAPKGAMLEIGCGKGLVVAALRARGFDVTGVELATVEPVPEASAHVQAGVDLFHLDPRRFTEVRTVLLLDVIEHLEDPAAFIDRIRAFLPAVQCIVYTVPARQELFSNYDRFNGHYRRYDLGTLRRHVDPDSRRGWTASYFFHLLYPAAWLQLRLKGERETRFAVPRSSISRLIHVILGLLFRMEYALLPSSWPGTSIIAAVRERADEDRGTGGHSTSDLSS